jgi:hypothetical protein
MASRADQVVLGLNGCLDAVADDARHLRCGRHRARVRVGERDLALPGGIHARLDRPEAVGLLPQMRQLAGCPLEPRLRQGGAGGGKHRVGPVELGQIPLNGGVDLAELAPQLLAGEVPRLRVHRLEAAAVDRDEAGVQQPDVATESHELLAHLADRRTVVLPEIGDRLEVRPQAARQPDELQVPAAFALQPPRRLDLVQIAVEVDPKHQTRMITRTPRRLWDRAEAERRKIHHLDEGVDDPDRVLLAHVVVEALRQEHRLLTIRPLNEPRHQPLLACPEETIASSGRKRAFSHSLRTKRSSELSRGNSRTDR